jgi:alpha-tubulin suppressor-like RCC1 family protein
MASNLVANVTVSGNVLVLAASSNVQYMNAASTNVFTDALTYASGGFGFYTLAAGAGHTVTVLLDGTVVPFGLNGDGQLGLNDTNTRFMPLISVPGVSLASYVACGSYHTAVLTNGSGTVRTFGRNTNGQLGVNDTISRLTPVQVLNITSGTAIAGGANHTAVLLGNGTVQTFGLNTSGQLGVNDTTSRLTPVQVLNITNAFRIACGSSHTAVLLGNGTVQTFGLNTSGQLGVNDTTQRNTPVQVWGISSSAIQVACGQYHTAVLLGNGSVQTFGLNTSGQLGVNDTTSRLTPVQVLNISTATAVACGSSHTAVLLANGTVQTFGLNTNGQLGVNDTTQRNTPVQVWGISSSASYIVCGRSHTAVLLANGTVQTFGLNTSGQLGVNDTTQRNTPVQVIYSLKPFSVNVAVACGRYYTAVLLANGTIQMCGFNFNGQLGVNDTTSRLTPVQVLNITSATAVACGVSYTAVLLGNGTVQTFGINTNGQLGVNDTTSRLTPVQVLNISTATAVACGGYHTAVLLGNGTVQTFGLNTNGQLGVNDTTQRNTPVQVLNISTATAVACGISHTVVLLANGTVQTFGLNTYGQLGVNDTTSRLTPVQVLNITSATMIASMSSTSAFLLANGTVWTCGDNRYGALGINLNTTTSSRMTPVQVWGISSSAAAISTSCNSASTMYAILSNGQVLGWGANTGGQLGVNDTVSRLTPVQMITSSFPSFPLAIACNDLTAKVHAVILLGNGTVQVCGWNNDGQLGVNDTTQRNTPVQMLNITTGTTLSPPVATFLSIVAQTTSLSGGIIIPSYPLGIGRVPVYPYNIDLSSDSARKLTTSVWTTGSDERIKTDIQTANLARCAEIVDSLDLKYFQWISSEHTDRHALGWIAQDVQEFFPKSVTQTASGTLALDSDQLIKVLWGAMKHTLNEFFPSP